MINIVIAALATWQAVEIWHHSVLLAPWRAITELWENKLGELLACPYCLSVSVAWLNTGVLMVADYRLVARLQPYLCSELQTGLQFLLALFVLLIHGLAVSRLANLGNDVFKPFCLTPHPEDVLEENNV